MKAVVHDRYGPPEVLRVEDVERPSPKPDELLVKVRATTVNRTDTAFRSAESFLSRPFTGLLRPKQRILGSELAGEAEAIGAAVGGFAVGDPVFGHLGAWRFGAHAEYVCVPESAPVTTKPDGLSFEEAASVSDGAILALNALRGANLDTGSAILVCGASGSIGTAGVQLAKHIGAHVTALCTAKTLDLVRSLGADDVIDYRQEDFTKGGRTYDVIFDAVGKYPFATCRSSLKRGGVYLPTDGLHHVLLSVWTSRIGDTKVVFRIPPRYAKEDVLLLKELIEEGSYKPVVDRRYPLTQVVEATRYVETGQKTGNVVLTVTKDGTRDGS